MNSLRDCACDIAKAKQALSAQVEEARNLAEEEGRVKASLAQQLRNLSGDCEELKYEVQLALAVALDAPLVEFLLAAGLLALHWASLLLQVSIIG